MISRFFVGEYVGDELILNHETLTTADLRHHDMIAFMTDEYAYAAVYIDYVLLWPDKRIDVVKRFMNTANPDLSLHIDESISAQHASAIEFFDQAFRSLEVWSVVPYVMLKPSDKLIKEAFYLEELDKVVKVVVEWDAEFYWFQIYYHWSPNLYPVQGPLLINSAVCPKSKLKTSRLRFIRPSVMIVVAGSHDDIENLFNNVQFWRQYKTQQWLKMRYLVSLPGKQSLSKALKIFGLFSDAQTIIHDIRLQCERFQFFTSLPDRCFSDESLTAPQVWVENCEHRPPFLTSLLVDLMLAFSGIPLYVLLEIADWLPYMFVYSRVKKVQTLEQTRESIQRVLRARDDIYKHTRSKKMKSINI